MSRLTTYQLWLQALKTLAPYKGSLFLHITALLVIPSYLFFEFTLSELNSVYSFAISDLNSSKAIPFSQMLTQANTATTMILTFTMLEIILLAFFASLLCRFILSEERNLDYKKSFFSTPKVVILSISLLILFGLAMATFPSIRVFNLRKRDVDRAS